jgi:hypothetical protein
MKSEELIGRTKAFAHRCVKLATALPENASRKTASKRNKIDRIP